MKPTDEFNTMKFNIDTLVDRIQHQLPKLIGGLLVLTIVWQGVIFGNNLAVAAPLLVTNQDRVAERIGDKVAQARDAAKGEIDYAKTPIQDRPGEVKGKVNDGLNYTPTPTTGDRDRVQDNAENISAKVKNFFGK
jgi:uncharacterized protein YjbJ (UPF0337 family)